MIRKILLPLIALVLLLSGCMTSSSSNRGSLSGAFDKSRDGYEDEREVPDEEREEEEEDPWWTDSKEEDSPGSESLAPAAASSGPVSLTLIVRGGSGFYGGPYFDPTPFGEILLGDRMGRWEFYGFAGFQALKVQPGYPSDAPSDEKLNQSIEDPLILDAGVEVRAYLFEKMEFMSPYLLARVGGVYLFWTLKNPIVSGDNTISTDTLGGLLLGCGAGVDLVRTESFKLGVLVMPEVYFLGEVTSKGFTNDYFDSQGVVKWAVEGGYRF